MVRDREREQEKKDFSNKIFFGVGMILLSTVAGILLVNVLNPALSELDLGIQGILALGLLVVIAAIAVKRR